VQFLCILTPWGISLVGDSPYFYTLFPKIQTYAAGLMCLKLYVEEMSSEHQITMVSLDQLVSKNHQYRKFKSLFNFKAIEADLLSVESAGNYKGYGVIRLFKCLLLQFIAKII
jgi:hypothetical protein